MKRRIRIPVKYQVKRTVKWTLRCACGRRYTARPGQTIRCTCGRVYNF